MKLLNFKIDEFYGGLYYDNLSLDLHSSGEFSSIHYIVESRELYLLWTLYDIPSNNPEYNITLKFSEVNHYKVTKRDEVFPFEADSHLLYINLIPNNLNDEDTYLEDFASYTEAKDLEMLLDFNSDQKIRISAESVELFFEKLEQNT